LTFQIDYISKREYATIVEPNAKSRKCFEKRERGLFLAGEPEEGGKITSGKIGYKEGWEGERKIFRE
jgi:hypothetical protein